MNYRTRFPKHRKRTSLHTETLETRRLLAGDTVAHWRAQDLVDSVDDGAIVSKWSDGLNGVDAIADGQPKLAHAALGGRATLVFTPDDGADWFVVTSSGNPTKNLGDFAVSVVFSTSSSDLTGGQNGDWYDNAAIIDSSSLGFANGWGISMNGQGQLAAGMGGGFGKPATTVRSAGGFNDGQTHLALLERTGDQLTISVDNVPVASGITNTSPVSSVDIAIGAQKRGLNPFEGFIADIRLFNGSLSDAQESALYAEFLTTYDNQAPEAVNDEYTLDEDVSLFAVSPANGVLKNDTDRENDLISAQLVEDTKHGRLSLVEDGSFIYIPEPDFFGTDSFIYSAVDFRPSSPATVLLHVSPQYDGAQPEPDFFKTEPHEILSVSVEDGLLANDANPDKETLTVLLSNDVNAGELILNSDGSFVFDPKGFAGAVTFEYQVQDSQRLSQPTVVSIVSNTPPVAVSDEYQTDEDVPLLVRSDLGVLNNDHDVDGDMMLAEVVNGTEFGELTLSEDGSFSYLPDLNFNGRDEFTYRITDGNDVSQEATVEIVVSPLNDRPVAVVDSYFALVDTTLTVDSDRGLLSNDSDVDGPFLSAELADGPTHGQVELTADGSFTYRPNAGFTGLDIFTYRATDSLITSDPVEVRISVSARPVVINELSAANASGLSTKVRETPDDRFPRESIYPDWIELKNLVGAPLDISGMHLTDSSNSPSEWAFPAGTIIPPNGYLVVLASGKDIVDPRLDENGYLHTNFSLDQDGEYVAITSTDGSVIHELAPEYPRQVPDYSWGTVDDEFRYFDSPTPGEPNHGGLVGLVADTKFSVQRGYYTEPFELTVTSATPGATLIYTTNGKTPTLNEGTQVAAPSAETAPELKMTIDGTTTLRVVAIKDGMVPSNVDTSTYFFLDDIVQQRNLWATVTNDPKWRDQLRDSFTALPTVSLVMDGRISASREIGTSVELIFPDNSEEGFQIDAGVEHYGGHSLNSPKKNMRLSFKTLYGDSKLRYDLFGDGATDEFDQILLRTGSHDNWFWVHPAGGRGNYLRNRWAFDRQLEMGHVAPHGRYVQVFINGEYWGIHHLMERPNASFMASYLGGEPEEYDALNAGTPIDGDSSAWRELQSREVISDYQLLQKYLDVTNYADYMLLQFYGGNDWDWNVSQNWAAARKREEGAGFVFFSWDSDVMLRTTPGANVVSRGGPGNLWNVRGGVKQHEEFRMLMADRAHKYFFNGGMLTSERLRKDMDELADKVRLAVIAETARWGRFGHNGLRYTPDVWEGAVEWLKDTFAPTNGRDRTETVLRQLRQANIYPDLDAPEYTVNGKRQHGGPTDQGDLLDFVIGGGTVYYTLDGTDPRLPGGGINPDAFLYDGKPIPLNSIVTVKSRALDGGEWSALSEAQFLVDVIPADASNLRITEVNYHPLNANDVEFAAGINDADRFEFIELMNLSSKTIDLRDARLIMTHDNGLEQGVEFNFGRGAITLLGPGEHLLVVNDLQAFQIRYGSNLPVAGEWSGGLSNRSEQLTLVVGDDIVHQFTYQDEWYPSTDGLDRSLEVADVHQELALWNVKEGWRASHERGGTPGRSGEFEALPGDANRDGIFNSSDLVLVFTAGEFEDEIPGNSTWEEGDWNGDGDFTTGDLVAAFQLGKYVAEAIPAHFDVDAVAVWRDAPDAGANKNAQKRPHRLVDGELEFGSAERRQIIDIAIQSLWPNY